MTKPPKANDTPTRVPNEAPGAPAPRGQARRPALSARARVGGTERPKRSPQAVAISVLVHVVVVVAVVQLLTFGHGLTGFLDFGNDDDKLQERLTYVATDPPAKPPEPTTTPVEPTRPTTPETPSSVMPSAPQDVPVGVAPVARADTGSGGSPRGTGNGVGEVNPNLRGVAPASGDLRVWQGPGGNGVASQRDGAERLDSVIGSSIMAARDSLAALARAQGRDGRAPGDWTKTTKDGSKWGWDQQGIRLGKVMIPNALLSLLPMNATTAAGMSGNYTSMQREARLAQSSADIRRMSETGMGDMEFRKLATELRDRRERERRDRLKAPSASIAPAATTQPPKDGDKSRDKSGGDRQ